MGALRLVSLGCHAVAGLASIGLAGFYLTATRFFPYHRDAVGADWDRLDPGLQTLLRALLHVAGGGWLACGVALLALVAFPMRRGQRWAEVAAPLVGLAVWVPTLWATIEVTVATPATAPWYGSAAAVALLVAGAAASAGRRVRAG